MTDKNYTIQPFPGPGEVTIQPVFGDGDVTIQPFPGPSEVTIQPVSGDGDVTIQAVPGWGSPASEDFDFGTQATPVGAVDAALQAVIDTAISEDRALEALASPSGGQDIVEFSSEFFKVSGDFE